MDTHGHGSGQPAAEDRDDRIDWSWLKQAGRTALLLLAGTLRVVPVADWSCDPPVSWSRRPIAGLKPALRGLFMTTQVCAPLLSRVKCWQLAALGLSGWFALYSAALLNWGAWRNVVGNAQGGCFAATMALAGLSARRLQAAAPKPADPRALADLLSTAQLNALLARKMGQQEVRLEACQASEIELGFGLRAINTGRTMLFETARWKEPVVDLEHAKSTETNRVIASADLAIIVGVGKADAETQTFVKTHPVRLLLGHELQALVDDETSVAEKPAASNG